MELLGGWRLNLVVAAAVILGSIVLLLLAFQIPRWLLTPPVTLIPFQQLGLDGSPTMLGKGPTGRVLQGTYRGMAVAVKRLTPPQEGTQSIFDSLHSTYTEAEEDSLLIGELHHLIEASMCIPSKADLAIKSRFQTRHHAVCSAHPTRARLQKAKSSCEMGSRNLTSLLRTCTHQAQYLKAFPVASIRAHSSSASATACLLSP